MQGPCPISLASSYIPAVLETNPLLKVDKVVEALAAAQSGRAWQR
jgi:hypothetical protein